MLREKIADKRKELGVSLADQTRASALIAGVYMELVNPKTGTDSYRDESGETRTRDAFVGLCITLNNDTLNKLKAQPQGVGTEVMITAKAVIRGLSARETDDGVNRSADLQITDGDRSCFRDVENQRLKLCTVTECDGLCSRDL